MHAVISAVTAFLGNPSRKVSGLFLKNKPDTFLALIWMTLIRGFHRSLQMCRHPQGDRFQDPD